MIVVDNGKLRIFNNSFYSILPSKQLLLLGEAAWVFMSIKIYNRVVCNVNTQHLMPDPTDL